MPTALHHSRRAKEAVRRVEGERDDAKCSASATRTISRKLNDERLVLFAREEGRRQGFEEGIQLGRLAVFAAPDARYLTARAPATPLGSGTAFIEEFEDSSSSTDVDEIKRHSPNQSHDHPDMAHGMHSMRGPEARTKYAPATRLLTRRLVGSPAFPDLVPHRK